MLKPDLKNISIFLIGIVSLILIRVLGVIAIAELIAVIFLPYYLLKGFAYDKWMKKIFIYLTLWLIGVIISDIYNQSSLNNSIKGFGNVVLFYPSFILAYQLLKNNYHRVLYYLAGKFISSILAVYVFPVDSVEGIIESSGFESFIEIWLVYIITPLIIFLVSWLFYNKQYRLAVISVFAFSIWALFNNSRNIPLTWGIVGIVLVLLGNFNAKNKFQRVNRINKNIVYIVLIIGFGIWGFKSVYEYVAEKGYIGEFAQNKYYNQKNSELGLLSGRIDFFQSIMGIIENPIMGYGSYAQDKTDIRLRFAKFIEDQKLIDIFSEIAVEDSMVPRHSYFLGAWVFSGILAVPFWILILVIIFTFLKKYIWYDDKMIAYFLLICMSLIWNIFFSPLSQRFDFCISIVTIILAIQKYHADKSLLLNFQRQKVTMI